MQNRNKKYSPKVKISITDKNGDSFMGSGIIWLLDRIKKFNSIKKASEDMNMSYMKAVNIIKRLEKNLGRDILIRRIGGRDHGGSELTPFAEDFVDLYKDYEEKVKNYSEKEFEQFYVKLSKLEQLSYGP